MTAKDGRNDGGKCQGQGPMNGTRNKRSVWTIPTAAYHDAHFATFLPDLIQPCILAGTSANGCCEKCGAPWVRELGNRQKYAGVRSNDGKGRCYQKDNIQINDKNNVMNLVGLQIIDEKGRLSVSRLHAIAMPRKSHAPSSIRSPEPEPSPWSPTNVGVMSS